MKEEEKLCFDFAYLGSSSSSSSIIYIIQNV